MDNSPAGLNFAIGNLVGVSELDVAEIELSAFSYSVLGQTNGNPSLSIGIYQTPGSNAQDIINEIKRKFPIRIKTEFNLSL